MQGIHIMTNVKYFPATWLKCELHDTLDLVSYGIYVNVVPFLMPLVMKKVPSIIIPTYF